MCTGLDRRTLLTFITLWLKRPLMTTSGKKEKLNWTIKHVRRLDMGNKRPRSSLVCSKGNMRKMTSLGRFSIERRKLFRVCFGFALLRSVIG